MAEKDEARREFIVISVAATGGLWCMRTSSPARAAMRRKRSAQLPQPLVQIDTTIACDLVRAAVMGEGTRPLCQCWSPRSSMPTGP